MSHPATEPPVIVVGAGLSGLACALSLQARGIPVLVLEASDGVGGRVRTDVHEGFLLDRGFQVLLTGYPEARRVLDYEALDLRTCYPGALVQRGGRLRRMADPTRKPGDALASVFRSVGSVGDKLRILGLRRASRRDEAGVAAAGTSLAALQDRGFGEEMLEGFLRPWLGGIFLESELRTPAAWMRYVFRMFSEGEAAVPARGMGEMPRQLASRLAPDTIRLQARVTAREGTNVTLASGETIAGRVVVVATEGPAAAALVPSLSPPAARATTTIYFAAEQDPVGEPTLVLDGEGTGPANHLMVMSAVAPTYAPAGAALIAVSVKGLPEAHPEAVVEAVRAQLAGWFGPDVHRWRHLRSYRIPYALPDMWDGPREGPVDEGVYVCGDWCETPSIQGALVSGRRVAEQIAPSA